jgi:hypothetical protein
MTKSIILNTDFLEFLNAWNASNTSLFGDKMTVINIIKIVEDKIENRKRGPRRLLNVNRTEIK